MHGIYVLPQGGILALLDSTVIEGAIALNVSIL